MNGDELNEEEKKDEDKSIENLVPMKVEKPKKENFVPMQGEKPKKEEPKDKKKTKDEKKQERIDFLLAMEEKYG